MKEKIIGFLWNVPSATKDEIKERLNLDNLDGILDEMIDEDLIEITDNEMFRIVSTIKKVM